MFSKNRKNIEIKLIMPEISTLFLPSLTQDFWICLRLCWLWFTRGEKIALCPVHSIHIYNIQTLRLDTQIVVERYFVLMIKYLYGMNQFLNPIIVLSVFLNSWSASASWDVRTINWWPQHLVMIISASKCVKIHNQCG